MPLKPRDASKAARSSLGGACPAKVAALHELHVRQGAGPTGVQLGERLQSFLEALLWTSLVLYLGTIASVLGYWDHTLPFGAGLLGVTSISPRPPCIKMRALVF